MSTLTLVIIITILFTLLFFSAFFSAAETAYSSASPSKIEHKAKNGSKSAVLIKKHYKSFGWTLATILISNNLVNIGASSLTTFLFTQLMGATTLVTLLSTLMVTPFIVIFGELIPKILAKKYSYGYLKKVVFLMEVLNFIFYPLTFPISKITLNSKVTNTEREIKTIINLARKEGVLETNEAVLAQKALDLDSKIVSQIMVKKEEIVWVSKNATVFQTKKMIKKTGHSRIVVKNNNKFTGVILMKDIIFLKDNQKISDYIIPLVIVSQSILVTKALEKMRINKTHLALVCQRKNSSKIVGLLTMEDVLEELVGEIYDEHDKFESIIEVSHDKYLAMGSTHIEELSKEIKIDLEAEKITLKQWLLSHITRNIKKGLKYTFKKKVVFKVVKNKKNEDLMIEIVIKN